MIIFLLNTLSEYKKFPSSQALLYSINQNGFLTYYILSHTIYGKGIEASSRKKKSLRENKRVYFKISNASDDKDTRNSIVASRLPFIFSSQELSRYSHQSDLHITQRIRASVRISKR